MSGGHNRFPVTRKPKNPWKPIKPEGETRDPVAVDLRRVKPGPPWRFFQLSSEGFTAISSGFNVKFPG
jgi:hypothetical protein